jgi:predicted dehydrogenase
LLGTQGSFAKQTTDPQENNLRHGNIPKDGPWGAEPQENWGLLTVPEEHKFTQRRIPSENCDFRDYYADVRDSLLRKAAPVVTTEWAVNVMRLLEMARESSERRCTIPWK